MYNLYAKFVKILEICKQFSENLVNVDSRTKCNREEELGEKFERGDVVMFLPGSVVE